MFDSMIRQTRAVVVSGLSRAELTNVVEGAGRAMAALGSLQARCATEIEALGDGEMDSKTVPDLLGLPPQHPRPGLHRHQNQQRLQDHQPQPPPTRTLNTTRDGPLGADFLRATLILGNGQSASLKGRPVTPSNEHNRLSDAAQEPTEVTVVTGVRWDAG
ncbi:MAG: hypothetical protein OXN44_12075 [Acidimicrobiaceae bacterium]|nr:hypothetical protein [Acidimicrobiaceae bacterium]